MLVIRLFFFAYDNTEDKNQVSIHSFKNYLLPTAKIENCNIEIDGRNFYDEPVNDLINTMKLKLKKYQQDKVMITELVVYWILVISKIITD